MTTPDVTPVRAELRSWLDQHWDRSLTVRAWWELLADAGWSIPTWPTEHGGLGSTGAEADEIRDEMARAGVLGPPSGGGLQMCAPILLAFGSKAQQEQWLGPLARGLLAVGQFFSEPNAGSDLAGVQTRAVRDGAEWIVNGQKIWNSGTDLSDLALLVTRSNLDVPKHRGITFFLVEVHQPGIEVRPIRQMNGKAEFNEAFLTDARVPDDHRIGDIDGGWPVALHVLSHERAHNAGGGERVLRQVPGGERHGQLDRCVGDVLGDVDFDRQANALPIGDTDSIVTLAREHGKLRDPLIRQQIARTHAMSEALRLTAERAHAAPSPSGAESSVAYLAGVRLVRAYRDLVGAIAGPAAALADTAVAETITTAPCHGIQGGAEQIQLNIIGERILGLPAEPRVDKTVPFREIPQNA